MSTIHVGDVAPDFTKSDLFGNVVKLSDYRGKRVILCFFRFATCPFCTVRYARMLQEAERFASADVQVIAVFESHADYIKKYLSKRGMPFPVIADPEGELYRLYALKRSFWGFLIGMMRINAVIKALLDKHYRMAIPDADMLRIPADFLIDAEQIVVDGYYGRDIGDHIPFRDIDAFVDGTA